jgi:hypothetical protein
MTCLERNILPSSCYRDDARFSHDPFHAFRFALLAFETLTSIRPYSVASHMCVYVHMQGPFEMFVDWRQCAAVMQRKAVTVMPSCSDGGNVVVA